MKGRMALTATAALVMLTGCFDVEFEIPVITQTATVAGNEVLHKANAKLHGEILEPAKVKRNFGLEESKIESVRLMEFRLQVTPDALTGPGDADDLAFVESMVIYVRSLDPQAGLKDIAVAWYYAGETGQSEDGLVLDFETDPDLELHSYISEGFELYSKSISGVPSDDVSVEGMALFSAIPGV